MNAGNSSAKSGALAITFGASVWGLYWAPLRYLDNMGVDGLWAISLIMGAACVGACLVLVLTGQTNSLFGNDVWMVSIAMGISMVLYFTGFLLSDVVRVVFLFYLLPVWTTLADRVLFRQSITGIQFAIIAAALFGLWLLLGGGKPVLPIPQNIGDWCGLLAGLCWGVSLSLLKGRETGNATAVTSAICMVSFALATVAAIAIALFFNSTDTVLPSVQHPGKAVLLAAVFAILLLLPSLFGQIWGAQRIAAPTAALLTMSEILVATVSAYLFIGTDLNLISLIGAGVILVAVLTDISLKFRH